MTTTTKRPRPQKVRGGMPDPRQPWGHRLLVYVHEARSEAEARAYLVRVFGPDKGGAAVLAAGTVDRVYHDGSLAGEFVSGEGWSAYLPECAEA